MVVQEVVQTAAAETGNNTISGLTHPIFHQTLRGRKLQMFCMGHVGFIIIYNPRQKEPDILNYSILLPLILNGNFGSQMQ
jgi:hypothetical protein